MRWDRLASVRRPAAVTLAALGALAAAFAVGGPFALAVAAESLAALALVITLAWTPGSSREHRRPPAAARTRAVSVSSKTAIRDVEDTAFALLVRNWRSRHL